ncbi:MAG: hypothetical protein JNL83_39090 [Myxococcales bacterium]|nr:hypothetical protein [Myxococcales bacterium]
MRILLAVVALAACDKLPAAPDAQAFETLSPEGKCEATLPRAKRCTDELLLAEVASLDPGGNSELTNALREDLGETPTYSDDAEAMHRSSCLGSRDDSYPRGVLRCWEVTPCKAFAECVYKPVASPRR